MSDLLKRYHRYRRVGLSVAMSLKFAWMVSTAGHSAALNSR